MPVGAQGQRKVAVLSEWQKNLHELLENDFTFALKFHSREI